MATSPTLLGRIWRGQIAVSAAVAGTNLLEALRTAGYPGDATCAVKLCKVRVDGSARPLLTVASPRKPTAIVAIASDFTTHGQPVPSGEDYAEPCDQDASQSYIRAPGGATTAQAVVVW